jgi:hypothetical protein
MSGGASFTDEPGAVKAQRCIVAPILLIAGRNAAKLASLRALARARGVGCWNLQNHASVAPLAVQPCNSLRHDPAIPSSAVCGAKS